MTTERHCDPCGLDVGTELVARRRDAEAVLISSFRAEGS